MDLKKIRSMSDAELDDALREGGATIMGLMESPLRGADGNVELFVHALAPAPRGEEAAP